MADKSDLGVTIFSPLIVACPPDRPGTQSPPSEVWGLRHTRVSSSWAWWGWGGANIEEDFHLS